MSKVCARAVNILDILKGKKYFIEDYQREYRWEKKHITDLIEDLTEKFLVSEGEDHYFLGSIIISKRGSQQFIIDGQQRLTSLTLLLIHIYRTLEDQARKEEIHELIYSKEKGFNLSVDLRRECMSALLRHGKLSEEQSDESIKNIVERYKNIDEDFPGHLAGEPNIPSDELELAAEALPKFAKWLIEQVYLVRITADSDADAYAVFETLNARGLSLTPTEMLKGYLLTKGPKDKEIRSDLNKKWKDLINELQSIGNRGGEDADAIKAWLRSQHAQDTRERKKDADPLDFERIGTEFHRWVRDKVEEKELQLIEENDFGDFISRDFSFYGKWYKFIRDAAEFNFARKNNVEAIHYNAHNNFTLQRTVLLAPLKKEESENRPLILRKLRIVSSFLDILIARRIWNYKSTAYSTMQYTMFSLIKDIRRCKNIDGDGGLIDILTQRLDKMQETFDSRETFGLHSRNTPRVRYLLARMTDYVWTQSSSEASLYDRYIKYEVEHIWAEKKYKEHGYDDEHEYREHRNRIGGLLLLPKEKNASLNDKPYAESSHVATSERGLEHERIATTHIQTAPKDKNALPRDKSPDEDEDKLTAYSRQSNNPLAYSLGKAAYKKGTAHSGFQQFIERSNLEFKPHDDFKKEALDERQTLYRKLCKQIWNPENLKKM